MRSFASGQAWHRIARSRSSAEEFAGYSIPLIMPMRACFGLGPKTPGTSTICGDSSNPEMSSSTSAPTSATTRLASAAALQGRCRVHALEPNPANFDRLRRHLVWNRVENVIQAHCLGLSDHPETVTMSQPVDNSGHTAVEPGGEIEGVRLTTLDAFCEAVGLDRLDVVVLDVEGFEERALSGANITLTRFKPLVFVEFFPPVMTRHGSTPEAAARY